MILPVALAAAAVSMGIASRYARPVRAARAARPDEQRLPDHLMEELGKASASAKVPLGLLAGWISEESQGDLARRTQLDERGYFQLLAEESEKLKLDHKRLSVDPRYSINAGLALIGYYQGVVDKLDVASKGSSYYWKLVKLAHSMGPAQVSRLVKKAKAAGKASTWDVLETYALGVDAQARIWFPFVDRVFSAGKAFGFGNDTHVVAGLEGASVVLPYSDIPDPLDVVAPRTDSPPVP